MIAAIKPAFNNIVFGLKRQTHLKDRQIFKLIIVTKSFFYDEKKEKEFEVSVFGWQILAKRENDIAAGQN